MTGTRTTTHLTCKCRTMTRTGLLEKGGRFLSVGASRSGGHVFVTDQLDQWYGESIIRVKILQGVDGAKLPPGKPFHLGNLSAAETHQLAEDAPVILDNILKDFDLRPGWDDRLKADIALLNRLLALYTRIIAPFFTAQELESLEDEIIATSAAMSKALGPENTDVPKIHLLIHTVMDMRGLGSLLTFSTEPMERRHQDLKAMAEQTNRRSGWELQLLLNSTRKELVYWSGTGVATREDQSDDETDDDLEERDAPIQCVLRGSRTAGTFQLFDMMSQNKDLKDCVYSLGVPVFCSRKAGQVKGRTLLRFSFQDTLESEPGGWLLKACPVLKTLGILTCNFLYHVLWQGSSGGLCENDDRRGLPDSQNPGDVWSWLKDFTNHSNKFTVVPEGSQMPAGVQIFKCLKISVPSLSFTCLRLRASPVLCSTSHGRAMQGATIVWVPYSDWMGTGVSKQDFTPLRNSQHMKLLRFARVECFFQFDSKTSEISPSKTHDMALIREFQVWECTHTACSFETIQCGTTRTSNAEGN